jgi:hypothetical protein
MADERNNHLFTPAAQTEKANALWRALATPPELRNVYYKNKRVTLDGYIFRECRFDGCTIVINSASFQLDRCVIDEQCVIQYGPEPVKVVKLFTSRYKWWTDNVTALSAQVHADGTISILG